MNTKIGIISLGLIGGSILKSLNKSGYELFCCTRNLAAIKAAKAYTPNVSSNMEIVKDCDIVFVCSPMSKTVEILDTLENIVEKDTIVADVCSLKSFVMQKKRPYVFIGTHPMAGTERNGFDASFADLFNGAKWVITPAEDVDKIKIDKLVKIIEATGAQTIIANPEEHDRAVALISHMPMLVAQALVKTARPDSLAIKLASSGFRDTTRLALSNTDMAFDMVKINSTNITEALVALMENAKDLLKDNYFEQISDIKDFRARMYDPKGNNIV